MARGEPQPAAPACLPLGNALSTKPPTLSTCHAQAAAASPSLARGGLPSVPLVPVGSHPPAFRSWGTVLALRHPCPPHSSEVTQGPASLSRRKGEPTSTLQASRASPFASSVPCPLLREWAFVSAETESLVTPAHRTQAPYQRARSDCSTDTAALFPKLQICIHHTTHSIKGYTLSLWPLNSYIRSLVRLWTLHCTTQPKRTRPLLAPSRLSAAVESEPGSSKMKLKSYWVHCSPFLILSLRDISGNPGNERCAFSINSPYVSTCT